MFVETPLWPDDLDGYRRLADEQPIPIASGEWLTTRFEHLDLMDRGHVAVRPAGHRTGRRPDRGASGLRAGGGARAADLPASVEDRDLDRGRAASRCGDAQLRLHRVPPRRAGRVGLRQDLTDHRLKMVDGVLPLPTEPGLGVELDREALAAYAAEARAVALVSSREPGRAGADRAEPPRVRRGGSEMVLYENHLPSVRDGSGDGIGDLEGLIAVARLPGRTPSV